jgi:death-on-curing protein
MRYVSLKEVLLAHQQTVRVFGGSDGLRDQTLVESALARPRAAFGDYQAYPDVSSKAAILLEGLIKNHGFVDGNKRTAVIVMIIFLGRNGHRVTASKKLLVDLAVGVASNKLDFDQILAWLKKHTKKIK